MVKRLVIYTDGASWGNPGPAAIGVTLKDERGKLVASISQAIGKATNNQAEYRAVIAGLEKAVALGAQSIKLKSDSELLVRQLIGDYRVRNPGLKPLHEQVRQLQSRFESFEVDYIPRELNCEADNLANAALRLKLVPNPKLP